MLFDTADMLPLFSLLQCGRYRRIFWVKKMEKLYTQQEAAAILGYTNYLSLNKLIAAGKLRCYKREGRCGRKLFTREQLDEYIRRYLAHS